MLFQKCVVHTKLDIYIFITKMTTAVIDFGSGPVADGQWKLIQTSDFCQIFSIESI
jgi:hypothetical protein